MHMIINAIVYAKDKESALEKANRVFSQMIEERHLFDYYTLFNDTSSTVSGPARWGKISPVFRAESDFGKKWIKDRFGEYLHELEDALKNIRATLAEYTDNEIIHRTAYKAEKNKPSISLCRYLFHKVGAYDGNPVSFYDNDGEGITDEIHLDSVLNKYAEVYLPNANPHKDEDVYVVPADVHY